MRGQVYKRCPDGVSGTRNKPACRKDHGSWYWRFDGEPDRVTGKRRQQTGSGYATREMAQSALNDAMGGVSTDDKAMTVEEWLTTWLQLCRDRVQTGALAKKTYTNYESHVRTVLIPHLGRRRLNKLRHQDVEDMVVAARTPDPQAPADGDRERKRCGHPRKKNGEPCQRWATGIGCPWHGGSEPAPHRGRVGRVVEQRDPGSLASYVRTLRAALGAAVRRDLIPANPAQGRIEQMPKKARREVVRWEPDDVARFLLAVQSERLAAMYELAAFAGLRRAELLGLKWSDVDLTSTTPGVTVRTTLAAGAGWHPCSCPVTDQPGSGGHVGHYLKPPKSDAGDRWVPITSGTIRELLAHQAAQSTERTEWAEAYNDHHLVFALENGDPLSPDAVTKRFVELAAAHGLPRIHLHDMRHGACSLLLAAGMPIEMVSLILGHANTSTTRALYAHILKAPASEWMRKAERLVRAEAA